MSRAHLAPLDGFRALATLSLIASHTITIATSLFPSSGPQWDAFVTHPLFVFMSGGGGVHTDMFLVVGGLLVGLQHRAPSVWAAQKPQQTLLAESAYGALRRALRLWPTLLAQLVLGFGMIGDSVDRSQLPIVIASTLFFFNMYIPPRLGGSYTSSPSWSVGVAFQCGVASSLLLSLLRRAAARRPGALGLNSARALFLALFAASFAIRAALFDEKEYSLVRLGECRHFAYYQTGHALAWVERTYAPFKFRAENLDASAYGLFGVPGSPKAAYALRYFNRLYFVTHARFGPFALGVFLGLCLPEGGEKKVQQGRGSAAWWWAKRLVMVQLTLSAAGTLLSTMLPPPPSGDDAPAVAHAISTIGLHNMTAMSVAWALFTVLCPQGSPWHNGPLRRLLSWSELRPLAAHSFTLNMLHFRVIFEMALRLGQRADPLSIRCVPHVLGLYVGGTAVSFVLAVVFDTLVEPGLRALTARAVAAGLRVFGVDWAWEDLAGLRKGSGKAVAAGGPVVGVRSRVVKAE